MTTTLARAMDAYSEPEVDPRWAAVVARDRSADGAFYYGVETTGVYCRPSCGSRRPKVENVRFFGSRLEAEEAGFRPCKRCRPAGPIRTELEAEIAARACRLIEAAEESPGLAELAAAVGLSPRHFHRVFKASTGLTPREYAAARRAARLREELGGAKTVTEAIYDAGFGSAGQLYRKTGEILGMTPTDYRRGGDGSRIHFAVGECSLGAILVAQSAKGVCAILLGDDPHELVQDLQDRFPKATLVGADRSFERVVARVIGFVESPSTGLDLPLDIRGTAFQERVWQALCTIPPGVTASYAEIAARVGSPDGARAVARACAANRLAVAVPCHRVVRSDGSASGYRWGVERKRTLLARERGA